MSGWLSYISGKRAPPSRDSTREAIIDLRQHLTALEKKEDFLNKKIEEEVAKAKAALAQGGANGKRVATNSLRQKKMHEAELEKIAGTRVTLETQVGGGQKLRCCSCARYPCVPAGDMPCSGAGLGKWMHTRQRTAAGRVPQKCSAVTRGHDDEWNRLPHCVSPCRNQLCSTRSEPRAATWLQRGRSVPPGRTAGEAGLAAPITHISHMNERGV